MTTTRHQQLHSRWQGVLSLQILLTSRPSPVVVGQPVHKRIFHIILKLIQRQVLQCGEFVRNLYTDLYYFTVLHGLSQLARNVF